MARVPTYLTCCCFSEFLARINLAVTYCNAFKQANFAFKLSISKYVSKKHQLIKLPFGISSSTHKFYSYFLQQLLFFKSETMSKSSKKGFLFMNIHVLQCKFIWTTFFSNQTLKFFEAMVRCLFWNFAIDPQKSYNDSCYELIIIEAQGPHYYTQELQHCTMA